MSIQSLRPAAPVRNLMLAAPAPPFPIFLTLVTMLSLVVGSYSEGLRLGPNLPIRTIIAVPMFVLVLIQASSHEKSIIEHRLGRAVLIMWAVLLVWMCIGSVVNGGSLFGIMRKYVGKHFTSYVTLLGIVWCGRGLMRQRCFVVVLAGLVTLSSIVALAQWRNQGWAWELPYKLNSPEAAEDMGADVVDITPGGLVHGLYATAFHASYHLPVGFALLLPLLAHKRWQFFAIIPLLIVGLATVIVQERSAVGAAAVCVLCFLSGLLMYVKGKLLTIALAILMVAGGGYVAVRWMTQSLDRSARYTLFRYQGDILHTGGRAAAMLDALASASQNPVFGTPLSKYWASQGAGAAVVPHNLFINAVLYGGVPQLLIIIVIVSLQLWLAWLVWKIAWKKTDYFAIGCSLAMLAYLLNCQFHNANVMGGDYLGWWITGLLIATLQNHQAQDSVLRWNGPSLTTLSVRSM